MIQRIAYDEYLPRLLGKSYRKLIDKYGGYNSTVRPDIANEFTGCAFRCAYPPSSGLILSLFSGLATEWYRNFIPSWTKNTTRSGVSPLMRECSSLSTSSTAGSTPFYVDWWLSHRRCPNVSHRQSPNVFLATLIWVPLIFKEEEIMVDIEGQRP